MITISAREASVLAALASSTTLHHTQRKHLLAKLSDKTMPIAEALLSKSTSKTKAAIAARAIQDWSDLCRESFQVRLQRRWQR